MAPYQYVPLDLSTNQIRLVRLRKGSFTDGIECEVFETMLEPDGVPYEALSYAGGDATAPVSISVNGQDAAIPWNLNLALNCLRLNDSDRLLWLDSLCIDASDKKEKGHQVALMGRIFQNAEQVLFWAGRGTDNTDLLMDLINKVDQYAKSQRNSHAHSLEERKRLVWPEIVDELGGTHTLPYQRRLNGLEDLLDRPWLLQIWALQEASCAKRASIVCGWKSVSSRTFTLVRSLMNAVISVNARHVLDVMPSSGRGQSWLTKKKDLKTLLEMFHSFETPNDEDKIYALLAISSDAHDSRILRVNYEIDNSQVSLRALAFLAFGDDVTDDIVGQLPSWPLKELLHTAKQPGSMASHLLKVSLQCSKEPLANNILNWKGFDINQGSSIEQVPLLLLASYGNSTESLRTLLLRDDLDINIHRSNITALEIAIKKDRQSVVELLLTRSDLDIERPGSIGLPPLALAVEKRNHRIAELLISRGSNVEWENPNTNKTLLRVAVEQSHAEIVRLLTAGGANVEATDYQWGATPLSAASSRGYNDLIPILLDGGADIEAHHRPFNMTALGSAVDHKNWDTAELLLKFGANPLFLFENGESISTRTASLKGYDFLEHLATRGVSLDSQDKWGKTPLHTVAKNNNETGARFLLSRGAKVDIGDSSGQTPLMEASALAGKELVSLLLSHGANINAQDDNGQTPLMCAVSMCKSLIVRVLLENGADVSIRGKLGETALLACRSWSSPSELWGPRPYTEILRLLAKHGADLNAQDRHGKTALMYVAAIDFSRAVRFLLKRGADKSLEDLNGHTAISFASLPCTIRLLEGDCNADWDSVTLKPELFSTADSDSESAPEVE